MPQRQQAPHRVGSPTSNRRIARLWNKDAEPTGDVALEFDAANDGNRHTAAPVFLFQFVGFVRSATIRLLSCFDLVNIPNKRFPA